MGCLSGARLWRSALLLAGFFAVGRASFESLLRKAGELETRLQAEIAERCSGGAEVASEAPCASNCTELQLRLEAAQKVKQLEDTAAQDSAHWMEVVEALQMAPASTCHDEQSWARDDMSGELNYDEMIILASMAAGAVVNDSYFLEDEVHGEEEWNGPHRSKGIPWTNKTLVYAWDPSVSWATRRSVTSAIEAVEERTCINFKEVPWDSNPPHLLRVVEKGAGCSARVGQSNGELNLGFFCRTHGVAVHELLHALGQGHEQSRPDRDYFLEVKEDNILEQNKHNFDISVTGHTARPYDYTSVMHYGRFSFSKNAFSADILIGWTLEQLAKLGADDLGDPTMKPRNKYFTGKMGNRRGMTDGDVEQLLDMYQCNKLSVSNSGSSHVKFIDDLLPTDSTSAVVCNPGYALTSCSCYSDGGDCSGATMTEVAGGTCVAAGGSDVEAHGICAKLASPHYGMALMSDEGREGTASQSCARNYDLVGCSCSTRGGKHCHAAPDFSVTPARCVATAPEVATAQALCLRSEAIKAVTLQTGPAGAESLAVCPSSHDLLGCSCTGTATEHKCKGARAVGKSSNSCKATAKDSDKSVVAHAICAELTGYNSSLITAEFLSGGFLGKEADVPSDAPVQNIYCDTPGNMDGLVSENGCGAISLQSRDKIDFNCVQSGCQQSLLSVSTTSEVKVTVKDDGSARCPLGWVVVHVACKDGCKSYELTCKPPPQDADWYLSGMRTSSNWFSGNEGTGFGSCGSALAIGLECAKSELLRRSSCKHVRLHCRRVALVRDDLHQRHSSFDVTFAELQSSAYVTSTGHKEKFLEWQFSEVQKSDIKNDELFPVQQMKCKGDYCDELRFEMPSKLGSFSSSTPLKGMATAWTTRFKTDVEMNCPQGHYVAGMKCIKSYCEQKELLCALPDPGSHFWQVSGEKYYSHCFTNSPLVEWTNWARNKYYAIQGNRRTCSGIEPSQMPNSQSCGEDGVVTGLRCFGTGCSRLQLVCSSIEVSVNVTTGDMLSIPSADIEEMVQLGLYDDMSSWGAKPENGNPSSMRWNGMELGEDEKGGGISISTAWRSALRISPAVLLALLAAGSTP